jgi:very-short-patch-repair endonuclease
VQRRQITEDELKFLSENDLELLEAASWKNKSKFKHSCGEEFLRSLAHVVDHGITSCPRCHPGRFKRTKEYLLEQLQRYGYEFVSCTGYSDHDKVVIKFSCGCEKDFRVGTLTKSNNRPMCRIHQTGFRPKLRSNAQEILKSLPYGSFTIVGEYINGATPVDIQCDKCKDVFNMGTRMLQSRKGCCPLCGRSIKSIQEEFLAICLYDLRYEFVREFRVDKYYYDFYIPSLNVLIEYDGEQHHTGNWVGIQTNQKEIDSAKNELAERLGYKLIRIPHTESVINNLLQLSQCSTTIP